MQTNGYQIPIRQSRFERTESGPGGLRSSWRLQCRPQQSTSQVQDCSALCSRSSCQSPDPLQRHEALDRQKCPGEHHQIVRQTQIRRKFGNRSMRDPRLKKFIFVCPIHRGSSAMIPSSHLDNACLCSTPSSRFHQRQKEYESE